MVPRTVLQYQLGERIGVGGMGEIYKARDTRLNRFVAMKVLSAGMSADPDRRRRFIQEGQAVSALNHPNIITIYDIVDDNDTQYMVVEYVDGKTLSELISQGALPVPQVIRYATQIVDALCAAHAAGIVHRDLKPSNVMVTGSGLVKVLDFGLAKVIDWAPADPDGPTVTLIPTPLTIEGTLLGTVNYMSPEQAEGKRIDARTDIFSLGAVLYEMLTGQSAFGGSSTISTLSAVLRDDVRPVGEVVSGVPAELESIVVKCLKKDPAERFQSMQEIQNELAVLKRKSDAGLLDAPAANIRVPSAPPVRRRIPWGSAVVAVSVLALTAGGAYWWKTAQRTVPPLQRQPIARAVETPAPAEISPESPPVTPVAPAPQPSAAASVALTDGLPFYLTLADDIPSDAAPGTPLRFRVRDDVRVGDNVVIRKGATASGAIVDAAKKKILSIGGKMTFGLDKVDAVDGQKVAIRATPAAHEGSSKRSVDTGARKPKDVAATAGSVYPAYIDGAKTVSVRN